MIQIIPAAKRYIADHGWLQSAHLFSFAEYFDPENVSFGNLRVFNDDTIEGRQGFGAHPHQDMEIVTIMLSGTLSHKDSMGNVEQIRAGEVQRMSAGTGVKHSEFNDGDETVHLYQIWIVPQEKGLSPEYEQMTFAEKKNDLVPLVSPQKLPGTLNIHANASISLLQLEAGREFSYSLPKGRGLFIYVTHGEVMIGDRDLREHDQARITDESTVLLKSLNDVKMVLIEVEL